MLRHFSTMVVVICNADVTYSEKQLTAGCVDETSVHFGFMVDNDYDIRFIEYNELKRSLSLAIVIG